MKMKKLAKKVKTSEIEAEIVRNRNGAIVIKITIHNGDLLPTEENELPTKEKMCQAVKTTVKEGLWWSNRSWAVVYRAYQIKGYKGGYSNFLSEAKSWELKTGYKLNYDAIQKPISKGLFHGEPSRWEENGAPKPAVILANRLLELLQ